mgnify:CR=1 FL=1
MRFASIGSGSEGNGLLVEAGATVLSDETIGGGEPVLRDAETLMAVLDAVDTGVLICDARGRLGLQQRAYPQRLTAANQTALTMMLLGMINWTFTWLRPGGPMSYAQFAEEVVAMLEKGLG